MLGSMVFAFLRSRNELEVEGTCRTPLTEGSSRSFDVESFTRFPEEFSWLRDSHWIINCIGVLHEECDATDPRRRERAILVNALFPHRLASFLEGTRVRVLQIASDGVFSGSKGGYDEAQVHDAVDLYGRTKSLGEVPGGTVLHVRCSIVGPDPTRRRGLLEWLLSHPAGATVPGFLQYRWNGVTTLQYAELCHRIISQPSLYEELVTRSSVHHFVPNETLTKSELLRLVNRVYDANVRIEPVPKPSPPVDRSLASRYDLLQSCFGTSSMEEALSELRGFGPPRIG
jgi:dTDP-4-dehydrorhamnose reductase